MPKTAGMDGNLNFAGNSSVGAHNMSIPQTIDKLDSTVYGDDYRRHITGLKSATVSADCKLDTSDVSNFVLGTKGMLIAQLSTGEAVYGTASLLTKTPTVPVDGINTETLGFEFDGTFQNT